MRDCAPEVRGDNRLNVGRESADHLSMIRMRFTVALLAVLALIGGGYAWAAFDAPAAAWVGATDPAHVAAAEAMLRSLPTPAGMTLDPYGTGCNIAGSSCLTSSSVEPEAAAAAMTKALAALGGRVRSHACGSGGLVEHGCAAVADYRGSRIEVGAGHNLPRPGNARTYLRLSVSGAGRPQPPSASAPYGSWNSVDPLPTAWTTGVTCTRPRAIGCSVFDQPVAASPVISAGAAEACATVRRVMEGHYYLAIDADRTATAPAGCSLLGHRYRSAGGTDGETLAVLVFAKDADHVVVRVMLQTGS